MNYYGYKPVVGIDPTDKYEKAKKDVFTAVASVSELDDSQKNMLVHELVGPEMATVALQVLQMLWRR